MSIYKDEENTNMSCSDDEKMAEDSINDSSEVPFVYSITSYGADYSVEVLVRKLDKEEIYVPQFQRGYIWTFSQACRFIESLLLGLPVPGIFLAKEKDSQKLLIIDGSQRLKTLQYFYHGDFKWEGRGFTLKDVQHQFVGKNYETLKTYDKMKLDETIIHATIIKLDASNDTSSIFDIFERINTGGTPLNPQEIRSSIFHGEFNELLIVLNSNKKWRSIYGETNERLKDVELILRFFALYFRFATYKPPMVSFLNHYMGQNKNLKEISKEELSNLFNNTIEIIHKSLGDKAFKLGKAINAAIYDAVMVGVAVRLSNGDIKNIKELNEKYNALLANPEFIEACKSHTSDEKTVRSRINLAIEIFKDVE